MEINELTHTIIGCAYKVHNILGSAFLEKIYENALRIELNKFNIEARQQQELRVWYEGHNLGHYYPDLWIDRQLIIEVKAVQNLLKQHELQLVHYLNATRIDDGLLINFGSSVQVKRKFREYTETDMIHTIHKIDISNVELRVNQRCRRGAASRAGFRG